MQVKNAAELKSREETKVSQNGSNGSNGASLSFDFKQYMEERAQLVNEALDKAVPLQYPEAVTEAMR